jgi:hypothetical protein
MHKIVGEYCETISDYRWRRLRNENWTFLVETQDECVRCYWYSLWVANLTGDEGDPDGRNVNTGLADRIG